MFNTSYVCFECRRSVKDPVYAKPEKRTADLVRAPAPSCPECHRPMHDAGTKFKAPARQNGPQGEAARLLIAGGFKFYGYGRVPRRPAHVGHFLARPRSARLPDELRRLLSPPKRRAR